MEFWFGSDHSHYNCDELSNFPVKAQLNFAVTVNNSFVLGTVEAKERYVGS
jgi:hypothetical protein